MTTAFEPVRVGSLELANRFVHSATFEGMADESGEVSERLVKRYSVLAKGGIGLIIPGALYVNPAGRGRKYQAAVYDDRFIPGLRRIVEAVHANGGKVAFQVNHAGGQTSRRETGLDPMAPSGGKRDPVHLGRPRAMSDEMIRASVDDFCCAARRVAEAGADGVQLHAAHGSLINQFLSPFFNRRRDEWGGSDQKRFRFLAEIVEGIGRSVSGDFPVLVKLNANDYTPQEGVTPTLAARYARWLVGLGVCSVEVSCGTGSYSNMNIFRGDVPVDELAASFPLWKRPLARIVLKRMSGGFDLVEGYNLDAARVVKPALGGTPLILVGGLRRLEHIERILADGDADLVSMSRPFIREPGLVRRFREGRSTAATCRSCNLCVAAMVNDREVRCYWKPATSR